MDTVRLQHSLTLPNDVNTIPQLNEFLDTFCEEGGVDMETTMSLNLAMEEAVVNVMDYAYPEGVRAVMLLEVFADDKEITFELRDEGMSFDPTKVDEVDVNKPADERPIGGLGVHLMRHYMDDIHYERIDEQNVLTMKKKLKK